MFQYVDSKSNSEREIGVDLHCNLFGDCMVQ